ncbi:hypothetical protein DWZ87_17285 [Roseburia intestinalis]|nr:hypothetical protein DWZ87_17285 [Roseburia intestinalis]
MKNRISNECKKEDDKRASSFFFYPYFPKGNKNSQILSFIPSKTQKLLSILKSSFTIKEEKIIW